MKLAENVTEEGDRLIVETIYDIEPALKAAAEARATGDVVLGSKGQQLLKVCDMPMEHILKIKEESGYSLLSPDPAEWRAALLWFQENHPRLMWTDKKVFTGREAQKWV